MVHLPVAVHIMRHGGAEVGSGGVGDGGGGETGESGGGGGGGGGFIEWTHNVLEAQASLLLLGFRRQLPVTRLDAYLLHRQRSIHVMKFVVEAASVADGFSVVVASPQRRHRRLAVGAGRPGSPRCRLQIESSFGFDERSVLAVHLVVEAAGVAEVMAGSVPPPQRRRRRSAVDAFATLFARFGNGAGRK